MFKLKIIPSRIGVVKQNYFWGDGIILLVCDLAPKKEFYLNRSFMGNYNKRSKL